MKPHHHKKRNFRYGQAHHLVLSSSLSLFSQNRIRQIIESLLLKYSDYFGIKIYHRAVLGTHIHLILVSRSEEGLSGFLRVFSGQVSAKLRQLRIIPKKFKTVWKDRPWSRVLSWGQNYTTAIKYVALNYLESLRMIKRTHKKDELRINAVRIQNILARGLTELIPNQRQGQLAMRFS